MKFELQFMSNWGKCSHFFLSLYGQVLLLLIKQTNIYIEITKDKSEFVIL